MAHFAKIENNIVTQVIVVENDSINNLAYPDSELAGQAFINSIGLSGKWLQASYNSTFRKNFPGTGYSYDATIDAFIPPRPYPSWILNNNAQWVSPVSYPDVNKDYQWNENSKKWVLFTN